MYLIANVYVLDTVCQSMVFILVHVVGTVWAYCMSCGAFFINTKCKYFEVKNIANYLICTVLNIVIICFTGSSN